MRDRIVFATGNQGKMKEIRAILEDLGMEVVSMREAGFEGDIEENGSTFAENAAIKARAVWERTGGIVMADDSGLEIDWLGGEPGVYSARYLGDAPYEVKNRTLIERLDGVKEEDRTARFVCVIAVMFPDGSLKEARASMEGRIALQPAGSEGFGYDPILYLPELGKTSAQISMEEKNKISHRGKALRAVKELLKEYGRQEK